MDSPRCNHKEYKMRDKLGFEIFLKKFEYLVLKNQVFEGMQKIATPFSPYWKGFVLMITPLVVIYSEM